MAQDDFYYEIQLTNKQLVFYFLAGAIVLILAFLAGVWVGRSVEGPNPEAQVSKPIRDEKIVVEEPSPPTASPSVSPAEPLTYAQRLESERPEDALDRPKPAETPSPASKDAVSVARKPVGKEPSPSPKAAALITKKPAGKEPSPSPKAGSAKPAGGSTVKPVPGAFTIQVGAFKDRTAADSIVARLKAKGYAAYVAAPDGGAGGLFNVRVGSFAARADAERVQVKLRDEEKYKPFIVKQ